ncbi:CPA2 family monovalent cation:H+ antiporter-2 [Ereboglobus sp. PH5-10]|uniref:cation:proton antiporter domain-containing protein n=1 Tax=Ereboglobus sp. PH5-10 TaxID=2940629 RepID=UPI002406B1A7|nr:cation:proton antiporter [Ereboglobus sp. PH5-10]MDF9827973.1 CPA2 family monovalent cation:H+ antiporter-2 [Ereboglobus sp. PH5-10]
MHNTIIQDLGILLLAAGVAGIVCKRFGLSVIVGYLIAGIIIGPHTSPVVFIHDEARIKELSELGLVFVMFSIGLELSLSKIGRMGFATLAATALGAFFMLQFTLLLGWFLNWSTMMSLFVAAMLMVSSSAVISKIMQELKLHHDRAAQMALAITVVEDVVAVIMLTVLSASVTSGDGGSGGGVGMVLGVMGAFVVLLIMAGLLLMPRVLRKLEKKNDPEIQTIIVVGLLLLCAFLTVKAGYSMAMGAFLFGAVVAEIKQKIAIEKDFGGIKYIFSSVFFVSIGMLIDLRMLGEVWLTVVLLGAFSLFVRPIACGFALVIVGIPPRQARRGGLLLTPLGEFTFIIAQAGVTAAILPASFYPVAVGLSILTVLATPILNRFADPILNFVDKVEPRFVTRAIAAYHGWLQDIQTRRSGRPMFQLIRGRLPTLVIEILLVSGLLIFSGRILTEIEASFADTISPETLGYIFWCVVGVLVLIPLVAVWRNLSAIAMIIGEGLGGSPDTPARLQSRALTGVLKATAAVGVAYWLYALLPLKTLPGWGWAIIGVGAVAVMVVFSNKLIYWYSSWESSVQEVLAEDSRAPSQVREEARVALDRSLGEWDVGLDDCVVPRGAEYTGRTLAELAIPTRFGCSILEVERNGHVITATDSGLRLYPGDKLLLLGQQEQIDNARAFFERVAEAQGRSVEDSPEDSAETEGVFGGSVLETFVMPECERAGRTLADLRISQATGVRVAGIRRGAEQIVNPGGGTRLLAGDCLLVVGTIVELRVFRNWIVSAGA